MMNIYDDHDIIDGFGSYPHQFMECAVFCNLGRAAHKYYLLFQHQSSLEEGTSQANWDKSVIFGEEKGPYISEFSRSLISWLGKDVLFLGIFQLCLLWPTTIGIDNRTERTRYKINYDTTYQKIFERINQEAVKGKTKHLIVMLGERIFRTLLTI
jgi:hypothetical protein